ncbi:hypothetical protein AWC17_24160 [Mycobacterium nebraskense]|uniref:Uncharacterized protein n=2 Tax=Mycobacterium nebraskense TaxID=244292 RepID=A0A1X2A0P9_9MYCO|nr:hypothetical protein WU83_19765 [Mycobacterium nebraskense]ORW34407.1 hypothetical protein AWC17_24160 [Mycobacterium nebraskense]
MGAKLRGEVPADEVLALLSVGGSAYQDYLSADQLREELAAAGIDPWFASPAESSQLLATWNAYALQSLGQAFVEAERPAAGSGGFLPRVTAEQALRFLREVPGWSARARRAATDPGFDVAGEVALPAPLPQWVVVEPCPRSHLQAMRTAGATMLERLEAALADLDRLPSAKQHPDSARLHGYAADVRNQLDYAGAMLVGGSSGTAVHEGAELALREAITTAFYLGQVVARPRLAKVAPAPPPPSVAAAPRPTPAPRYLPPPWSQDHNGYGHHGVYGHHGHH